MVASKLTNKQSEKAIEKIRQPLIQYVNLDLD
jgi:hypothetical protein